MSNDENNQKTYNDRRERLKIIEKLLEGMTYNNTAAREAIYIVTVSGFDQLQATVQILAEIAEYKNMGATEKIITDNSTQLFIRNS